MFCDRKLKRLIKKTSQQKCSAFPKTLIFGQCLLSPAIPIVVPLEGCPMDGGGQRLCCGTWVHLGGGDQARRAPG